MDAALRDAILAAIPDRRTVYWAGVAAEYEGNYAVHVLRNTGAPASQVLQLAGHQVRVSSNTLQRTEDLVRNPIDYANLLSMPMPGWQLLGTPPANVLAPRMNAAVDEDALLDALGKPLRRWLSTQPQALQGLAGVAVLKARALYGYVQAHRCMPTADEYYQFVQSQQAPWGVALCAARRSARDLAPSVFQTAQVTSDGADRPAWRSAEWIEGWAGGGLPNFAGKYAPATPKPARARPDVELALEPSKCAVTSAINAMNPTLSPEYAQLRW